MPAEKRRLNVHVDLETHRELRLEAARRDCSIQDLVEAWIREKIGLPPKPDEGKKGGACLA